MKPSHPIEQTLRIAACACLLAMSGYARAGIDILAQATIEANKNDPCFFMETVKKGKVTETTLVKTDNCTSESCYRDEINKVTGLVSGMDMTVAKEGNCVKIKGKTEADPNEEDSRLRVDGKGYRQDNEKSGYYQFGGDWPQDEYTQYIPKPDLAFPCPSVILKKGGPAVELTVNCNRNPRDENAMSVTPEFIAKKAKAYAEILKAKGFTIDARLLDGMPPNVLPIGFSAKNGKGYFVRVLSDKNMNFVTLKNPAAVSEEGKPSKNKGR
ncbi:MAG: hypothetical protein FWD51_01040 [Betaproteobacteria bacterium]|nr:hypothetical protein [Betaproteobacteria bacterium]